MLIGTKQLTTRLKFPLNDENKEYEMEGAFEAYINNN